MEEKDNVKKRSENDIGSLLFVLLVIGVVFLASVLLNHDGKNGLRTDATKTSVLEYGENDVVRLVFKGHEYFVLHMYNSCVVHDPECVKCKEGK